MPTLRLSNSSGSTWPHRSDRWFLAALVATSLGALSLRLYHLGYESLDMDELVQVRGYTMSPYGVVLWAAHMGQPVLDYIIGAVMCRAGLTETDAAARIPAALFGAGGVMLFGLLAGRIAGRSVGIASAIFLAVCPFHVILSQHARQYTIFVFFALAALMTFDRARRRRNTVGWALFSASVLALLMTRWVGPHIIAIAIAGYSIAMWVVARRGSDAGAIHHEKGNLYATTVAMAVPYLVSAPIFILIFQRSRGAISTNLSGWVSRAGDHLAEGFRATLAGFSPRTVFEAYAPDGWFVTAAITLLIIGLVSLVRRAFHHQNRHAAIFLASLCSFPIIYAIVYACFTRAMAKPQYLLVMALPVCLTFALAAKVVRDALATRSQLAGKFAFAGIVAGAALPMYIASLDCLNEIDKRDWRGAMTYLREHASKSDAFAVAASDSVPSVFVPLAYGKFRYGIPQAKFLPIRQTTNASVLVGQKWSKQAGATWLLVYTDRMYLGYDQVRPPAARPPLMRVHHFNGLFLIESRASRLAADQLIDAIVMLYRDLPPARSLIAPALLRAKYLGNRGDQLAARESLDDAIRQCRNDRESAALRAAIEIDPENLDLLDAHADARTK